MTFLPDLTLGPRLPQRRRFPLLVVLLLIGWAAGLAWAEDTLANLQAGARTDLEQALAGLSAARQEVEAERLPLAREVNVLEQRVLDRRRELERAERANENTLVVLNAEKSAARARGEEVKFIEALFGEYLRVFETRIHIAESEHLAGEISAAKDAGAAVGQESRTKLERQAVLLDVSLARITEVLGGTRFEGTGLSPSGRLEPGTFLIAGPAGFFASSSSDAVGLAELQLGAPGPTVVALPKEYGAAIRAFIATGQGTLPIDLTGGNALKLGQTQDTILRHILKGGPVMVPILLLALFALTIFAGKWLQIGRVRVATPASLQAVLSSVNAGDRPGAADHARKISGPIATMLVRALEHVDEPKEYIEEVMYEEMLQTKPRLEQWLPFLALSAAAAPLLGLLGTVTGMINTFNMITVFGTGDPKTLAGGISEALITTEYGLIVAIPSLLLHSVLSRRVKGVLGSMEQTTVAFINGLEVSPQPKDSHVPVLP